jgi:hypothetical protein
VFFETAMNDSRDKRAQSRAQHRPLLALGALAVIATAGLSFMGFAFFGDGGVNAQAKEPPLSHFIPPRQQLSALAIEPVKLGIFHDRDEPDRTAPAIPAKAVMYAGDATRVWVAGNDGSLALRDVTLGATSGDQVEVTRGLSAGEKIVTNGALFTDQAMIGQ